MRIVCFGPGPKFKGGIANYNTSLARALDKNPDNEVYIVSWTQQYPAIIPRDFIDRKSRRDQLSGTGIKVLYLTNYNNPLSWFSTARSMASLKPDMVIFQWAIAIQGLPLGIIVRQLKRLTNAAIVFDLHFVVQKEGSKIDALFTRFVLSKVSRFVVHASKTAQELKALFPKRKFSILNDGEKAQDGDGKVVRLYHPVYDMFEPDKDFDRDAHKSSMNLRRHVFLFFGFIRKYKGLHLAIEAFSKLRSQRDDVSLLIVGESFWQTLDQTKWTTRLKQTIFKLAGRIFLRNKDDERDYKPLELIEKFGLQDSVYVVNEFVPNEEVHKYFQVSDNLLLFYLTATPSGVESIGYNFRMPMLATAVGHFPETIQDGFNGYLARPLDTDDMCRIMQKAIENPIPREHVAQTAEGMSWVNYADVVTKLLK
ncbi:MAG TPA: glycosyltransferase [Bacteroidales bacterium]|nr:glycosyltransferase [Bacteroidales bacterium]